MRKTGTVQELREFFDRENEQQPLNNPRNPSTRPPRPIQRTLSELPGSLSETAPIQSNFCIPLSKISKKYFDKAFINQWTLFQALQTASTHHAGSAYQHKLFHLLDRQKKCMDALYLSMSLETYTPYIPEEEDLDSKNHVSEKKQTTLFDIIKNLMPNSIHEWLSKLGQDSPTADDLPEKTQREIQEFLSGSKSSQSVLRDYPNTLIQIIKEYLALITEPDYQNFLERVRKEERTRAANTGNSERQSRSEYLIKQSQKNFDYFVIERKHLNQEFREMLSVVLYTLLLNIRKQFLDSPVWANHHPSYLLRNQSKNWMTRHNIELKPYLSRDDITTTKNTPITYPILVNYQVRRFTNTPSQLNNQETNWLTTVAHHEEIRVIESSEVQDKSFTQPDDINQWLARIERCQVVPTVGHAPIMNNRVSTQSLIYVLESNEEFLAWLHRDASVSFRYHPASDKGPPKDSWAMDELTFSIKPSEIRAVSDDYFYNLEKTIQRLR